MKQNRMNIIAAALATVAMSLGVSCMSNADSPVAVVETDPEVTDVEDTGCQTNSRSAAPESQKQAIVLTREGDDISCEVRNYVSNCGVTYFDISQEYRRGKGKPDSLFVDLNPVIPAEMDCTCPYTVYFTLRNVKADSFFLHCGYYTGMVSFKESSQVAIELQAELVTIDGWRYYIYKPGQQAMLYSMGECKGELQLPPTFSYEGEDYYIEKIGPTSFEGDGITKVILPKSIREMQETRYTNFFSGCSALEAIEVEAGSSLFSSVDGVLYSSDLKTLYSYPRGSKRTSYTVPDGVEKIGNGAFGRNPNLTSIRIPESVSVIESGAFYDCTSLESVYIMGKLERRWENMNIFSGMTNPVVYVPESEVEYVKSLYNGPVLPLQ